VSNGTGSIRKILISDIRYRYTDIDASEREAKCMSEHEWNRPRHFFAWGIFALLAVIVASVAVSAFFFATRSVPVAGTYYPSFFFPFPLFFIFGIFAFFWIARWLIFPWRGGWRYRGRYWRHQDESYYIIRERYAKGEITKEQFEQMMRDLQQQN
jgi:putative membrane protein